MTGSRALARQVSVEPLSVQRELSAVVRGAAAIGVLVWIYLASAAGADDRPRGLLPFQVVAEDRPATEQRMFRELQEGLLEAEVTRSTTGTWPSVEALVAEGIPPFAPDPTATTGAYRWALIREGAYVNYLGIPDRTGLPSWVVLIQEPQPGVPPDQTVEDEEHHRLIDGTMLHVSTWSHAGGPSVPTRLTVVPQSEGWMQVYAVGPGTSTAAAR